MMDELTALRETLTAEPPSPAAHDGARAALMAHIAASGGAHGAVPAPGRTVAAATPVRRRRWALIGLRSGLATATAAGAVGVAVLVSSLGNATTAAGPELPGTPGASVPADAKGPTPILELAAQYAAARPSMAAPRPDQWIFIEMRVTATGALPRSKGMQPYRTDRSWVRADGKKYAGYDDGGRLYVIDNGQSLFPEDYETLANLPTDPRALLSWVREKIGPTQATPIPAPPVARRTGTEFSALYSMLLNRMLTPEVEAAAIRALALLPTVAEVPGRVHVNGHTAIAIGQVTDGWLRTEILVDSRTHQMIGFREIAVADYTLTAPGLTGRIKKNEVQGLGIRTAAKVVDRPGQTH